MMKCDVCAVEGRVEVTASRLGAISLAYCKKCLTTGAEPFELLSITLSMLGRQWEDRMDKQLSSVVSATLEATNNSMDDLRVSIGQQLLDDEEFEKMYDAEWSQ